MKPKLKSYTEKANQELHSKLLFARRVDVVLADGLIFAQYNRQLIDQAKTGKKLSFDPGQPVTFWAIFPPSSYGMLLKTKRLQETFDRCFAELQGRGDLAEINKRYVDMHRDTVGDQYLGY